MAEDRASETQRWQTQATVTATYDNGRRRWFIILAALFLVLGSTAVVWFLLIKPLPPPPFLLTIDIGDFNARQYPVLAFARQDGERLGRHFPDKRHAETKTRELLLSELNGLARRSDPLIVHIAALALVRDDSVYLVPGDADPDDDATLLDVRQIVDAVGRCPARHKLLVLDLAHPLADARLGVLADRVSQTLEDYLRKEPPGFFVLCPTSAGQYSLRSEALQSSVLADYIDQGLQGAADADKDLRVTVQELFAFVQPRVERWAQLNRGMRQRPRLFGNADDFVLAGIGKNTPPALERPKPTAYPATLKDGWQKRDHCRDAGALSQAPRLLMRLEATLLRQEALWRGGALARNDWQSAAEEIGALDRDLAHATVALPTPPRSLAVAVVQAGVKDNPALTVAVQNMVAAAKDTGAKKDARIQLIAELLKKLQEPKGATYAEQAWTVVTALDTAAELRPGYLQLAHEVLGRLNPDRRYVEVLCVRRLAEFAERVQARDPDSWPAEKAHAMLHAVRLRAQVVAALTQAPEALPRIAATVAQGDVQRQRGEHKLLWERPSQWPDAQTALEAAIEQYRQARDTVDNLRRGRQDLDYALAKLPAYISLICDWPEFDVQAEASLRDAAREALAVQRIFAEPADKDTPLFALDAHCRGLRRHLEELEKTRARRGADAQQGETGVAVSQLLCLLQTSLLQAPQRLAIFAKQRALEATLQGQTDTLDQEDARPGRTSAAAAPAGPAASDADVGLARARLSLALLRLAGVSDKELSVEPDGKLNAQAWTRLERGIQGLWANNLVKQWRSATTLVAADTLDRVVPPWELDRRPAAARDPSRLLYKQQRQALVRWLAASYESDAHALEATGRDALAASFFREAARELRVAEYP